MTRQAISRLEALVKSQFDTMAELAAEIRRLKAEGHTEEANKLARILDKLSKDSLEIGTTIRDRSAA